MRAIASILLAPGALWASQAIGGESPGKVYRVGFLRPTAQPAREQIFRRELERLGYTEGRNVAIAERSADGDFARLPALAEELVRLNADVIVAVVTQASVAAKKATSTIPIVMVGVGDPVRSGLVADLAHPGGNVTGTSTLVIDVVGKQLQLLHELVPKATRASALWNPSNRVFQEQQLKELRAAAARLRVQLGLLEAKSVEDLDRAFATMSGEGTNAVLVLGDPLFATHAHRIADLALALKLPAVGSTTAFAEAGLLATYGPDFDDGYRRAAWYVSRILAGTKPANLPVEQSTKFELVINARTARALGVTIPPSLSARADRVIE